MRNFEQEEKKPLETNIPTKLQVYKQVQLLREFKKRKQHGDFQLNSIGSDIIPSNSAKDGEPNKAYSKNPSSTLCISICTSELRLFEVAILPWCPTGFP